MQPVHIWSVVQVMPMNWNLLFPGQLELSDFVSFDLKKIKLSEIFLVLLQI